MLPMTIAEIKAAIAVRGMTQQELAKELGISHSSIRQILSGASKLTEQLSKHIEYVLNRRKQQTFVFTVDLPDGTVQRWVPGFDTLTEEEKQKTLHSICENIMQDLAAKDAATLTEQERTDLAKISGLTPEQAVVSPPLAQ